MTKVPDQLHERMQDLLGQHVSEAEPMQFLEDAGFTLGPDLTWHKIGVDGYEDISDDEYDCLRFLVAGFGHRGLAAVVHRVDVDADLDPKKHRPSFGHLLMSSGLQDGDLPERDRTPLRSIDL